MVKHIYGSTHSYPPDKYVLLTKVSHPSGMTYTMVFLKAVYYPHYCLLFLLTQSACRYPPLIPPSPRYYMQMTLPLLLILSTSNPTHTTLPSMHEISM